jgi:hypothetical protein
LLKATPQQVPDPEFRNSQNPYKEMVDWRQNGCQFLGSQQISLMKNTSEETPDHWLVIDLEATCCNDGQFPREEMEIIEIGAVIADGKTFEPSDEFSDVRPSDSTHHTYRLLQRADRD